jgi:glycosyltransferase involved in cell wall biosynthesis
MKIIHLGNVPPPADFVDRYRVKATHPGRWVLNHAIAQKRAGMDVEVVAQAHKATEDFICEIEGVKVHFLRTFHPYRHFTFYAIDQFRMASYVKKLRPDIVHAHGTEAAYALAAIRTGLPFCVTAQGLFFQILPTLPPGLHLNERFIRMSEHCAWKRTRHAIAKSEYVRDALAKEYPHLDLTLIPNTYQPELDGELKPKTGKKLAFVGTIDERKGVLLIAEAMKEVVKQHPDVELHIVGNPPEGTGTPYAIEQLASLRQTLGERLVLHGRLPSTELFAVLDACVALLAPSLEEMFGNQLIEGLMRGCHGIVAEGTALAENVRRFGNGAVVAQNDPAALATAICDVLAKPVTAGKAESARQAIRDYMSPAVVAEKHRVFYARIVGKPNQTDRMSEGKVSLD